MHNHLHFTEALWFIDATTYRGCYTTGDGVTTFRIPDERGMSERMMDLGRGIDLYRTHNFPGGYEKDAILEHYHITTFTNNSDNDSGSGKLSVGGQVPEGTPPKYKTGGAVNSTDTPIGASENIVKNIGKLNLVKF